MNSFGNLIGYAIGWAILTLCVVGLALYRKYFSARQEGAPEMFGSDAFIHHQEDVAHRLDVIDRWGKMLTVVSFVFGIALAVVFLYNAWVMSTRLPTN
jgi:hypothetical protein